VVDDVEHVGGVGLGDRPVAADDAEVLVVRVGQPSILLAKVHQR